MGADAADVPEDPLDTLAAVAVSAKRAGMAPNPPIHRLMVNHEERVPIIDLTVDDLKAEEEKIDTAINRIVERLSDDVESMLRFAPAMDQRAKGGKLKFKPPADAWADAKTWEFLQIQSLVNLLTTTHGLKPRNILAKTRDKCAIECAEACGFFRPDEVTTKDHMNAHMQQWLPSLLQPAFGPCMAMLFLLLARTAFSPAPKDSALRENYKRAKSALENKRFSEDGGTILRKIVNTLVELDE